MAVTLTITAPTAWASLNGIKLGIDPGPGDSIAGVTQTTYLDLGAMGDTLTNYFYLVCAVDAAGNKSADFARVGEFDRLLEACP